MKGEQIGLVAFGIILFVIGLGASFYKETHYSYKWGFNTVTPYQSMGVVLLVGRIILIAVGFFIPLKTSETTA